MTIEFTDPEGVHAQLGRYSHAAVVPEGAGLVFISGQVGVTPDGTTLETIAEEADFVYVAQLVDPALLVEVEAVAAKPRA
jgi:enamine deaminase RidA (YjgF/YER057c/UK114 family)